MRMIQEAAGTEVKWVQPPMFTMEFELNENAGVAPLATLKWVSGWRNRAVAEGNGRVYSYDREGFLNSRLTVREGDTKTGMPLAVFKPNWTDTGTLTFANGKVFEWKNANKWHTQWKWVTPDGGELMQFTPSHEWKRVTRSEAALILDLAIADYPESEVLATLGWYLILLRDQDTSSTG